MRVLYVVRKKTNYLTNHNMKNTKRFYNAPEIQELEIKTEGVLCESTAGAGSLNDNSWDVTFGESEN